MEDITTEPRLSFFDDENEDCYRYLDLHQTEHSDYLMRKQDILVDQHMDSEDYGKNKMIEKSKRIQKRQQAKSRAMKMKEHQVGPRDTMQHHLADNQSEDSTNNSNASIKESRFQLPENFESLDPQQKKRMRQKIKNRISAQQSRDKQKVYIKSLEEQNRMLQLRNQQLEQTIKQMEQICRGPCRECMLKENQFYQDNVQIHGNHMGKLGVMMFMVVAIMMVAAGTKQQSHQQKTAVALQAKDNMEVETPSLYIPPAQPSTSLVEYTPEVPILKQKMDQNREVHSRQGNRNGETLVCPRGYVYRHESGKELFSNWVHVLLPQQSVSVYDQNGERVPVELPGGGMLELYCKLNQGKDQLR